MIDQIDHLIELKKRMISSFNKNAFTEETEKVFIEIIMDAVNLSLPKTKLDDFCCCLRV